ncbi:hypothetical protein [Methylobacterium sp. Leaf108]|uniref:hypothetical protein n=1 Tax=Methylobacterium sp. Leaf108 TaxID=1736256 RepID=UPI0006F5EA17|nr:hypothetical protein [Methylobacterium sp. Leaf108]KQP61072.1 hypothetical protein ASF39_15485 [Methylobacterium sp. Leaf108]
MGAWDEKAKFKGLDLMTTPKRPRDPNQLAKFIVDMVTGEAEVGQPTTLEKRARKAGLAVG